MSSSKAALSAPDSRTRAANLLDFPPSAVALLGRTGENRGGNAPDGHGEFPPHITLRVEMPAPEQASDLANRMAGWFFVVFGLGLLFFAAAIRSTFAPETPGFVWVLVIVGVAALVFGIVAPRNVRASVLDAVVTFIWV